MARVFHFFCTGATPLATDRIWPPPPAGSSTADGEIVAVIPEPFQKEAARLISSQYFPPASQGLPRRSTAGLLILSLLVHIFMVVGVSLASLLTIPYLPSFLYGSGEVATLIAGRGPQVPRTEIGQWYTEYQQAQDAALAKLSAISDPIPLTKVGDPALFANPDERQALHKDLGAYIGALHAWDQESHADLERSLAKLDKLHLPPGAAPRVRQVIGTYEAEWLVRQSGWVKAEVGWTTQVIDLYDWMEQADHRGALRLSTKEIMWVNARDQAAYQDRLMKVDRAELVAQVAHTDLNDWTAAQNPKGLWQIFLNWFYGYGLTPPPAPEPAQKIA